MMIAVVDGSRRLLAVGYLVQMEMLGSCREQLLHSGLLTEERSWSTGHAT
jgi:hypothetical protein